MIKLLLKSLLCIVLVCAGLVALERLCFHYTGSFSLANIDFESTPFRPVASQESYNAAQKEQLAQIIKQDFSFLGKGNQSYAFLSADGRYVLKFFKFGHLKDSWYQNLFRNSDLASRLKRFQKVFNGYQLAYEHNRENSGLLFIHLNKTEDLHLQVKVKDKLGISHIVDLDSVAFVIQERALPAKELLAYYLDHGNVDAAKERLDQLFTLYLSEYRNGLYDRDHNLLYNTGFTETRAIRFDVGKLRSDPLMKDPAVYQEDLRKIVFKRLDPWFRKHYPDYHPELTKAMEAKLQ